MELQPTENMDRTEVTAQLLRLSGKEAWWFIPWGMLWLQGLQHTSSRVIPGGNVVAGYCEGEVM